MDRFSLTSQRHTASGTSRHRNVSCAADVYERASKELRSTKVLVAIVALIIIVVLLAGHASGHDAEAGGPLAAAPGTRQPLAANASVSESRTVGSVGTFGAWILENTSRAPLTLLSATVTPRASGLAILSVAVVDRRRQTVDYGEPPADLPRTWLHPLAGYVLASTPTGDLIGAQLLVRYRPTRAGRYSLTRIRLVYRQGSRRYTRDVYARDLICAGSTQACPPT